jgi:hypothetical protein
MEVIGLDEASMTLGSRRDFNKEIARAIDAALYETVGQTILEALHRHLKNHYDIGSDQIPYHLPTIIRVLEEMFGAVGTRAIGSDVAKKLYNQVGLRFVERANYSLNDYIEEILKLLPNLEYNGHVLGMDD